VAVTVASLLASNYLTINTSSSSPKGWLHGKNGDFKHKKRSKKLMEAN